MSKIVTDFKSCLRPMSNTIVSCRDKQGKNNALVVAYASNCSMEPPMVMVGIVPNRFSYNMVKETGVFVVNLVPEELKDQFVYLGTHSGREEDKLTKLGMKVGEAVKINAPILLDCPVSIECTVIDSFKPGSHEFFIGKVEYVHAKEELIKEDGTIDYSKINFLR